MNYAYEKPGGEIVWRKRALSEGPPPREIEVDGETAKRSYRVEQAGVPATKGWPIVCYASGVHADQAQELRDKFVESGVPTEVTSDGDPVYRSVSHRRRALRLAGSSTGRLTTRRFGGGNRDEGIGRRRGWR